MRGKSRRGGLKETEIGTVSLGQDDFSCENRDGTKISYELKGVKERKGQSNNSLKFIEKGGDIEKGRKRKRLGGTQGFSKRKIF